MNGVKQLQRVLRAGLGACALLLAAAAHSGVPHPGFVLYGKVLDENGVELHDGQLVWSFTPEGGGTPVTLSVELDTIEGQGGPYAYRVLIPFEISVPGYPASGDALELPSASASYVRQGALSGTPVVMEHVVELSNADVGSAKRVDVCVGCREEAFTKHSADTDGNLRFSLSELLRTFELHTATPTHDYHIDPLMKDGYGLGPGNRNGSPHTGDYDDGSDWVLSGREMVRMIDLFSGTPDHAYTSDATTPDGFKKEAGGAKSVSKGSKLSDGLVTGLSSSVIAPLSANITISGGAANAAPGVVDVNVELVGNGTGVTALGITDYLSDGAALTAVKSGAPALAPKSGSTNALDFAWFPVPALPASLQYSINISGTSPEAFLAAPFEGYYRTVSSEEEYAVKWQPSLSADGRNRIDNDGDGIADVLDGYGDVDGDGVANLFDVDSDNDGLSDEAESGLDGSPIYNPYDPQNNPNGTDSNINNPDTDGDGVDDGQEVDHGKSPLPESTSLPVSGAFGLSVLCAALAGSIARARRRK